MANDSRDGLFPRWLLWVVGPVTMLAAALIIFAVVLGIQAGQRQVETQRRQQVGIALQRAMDYRTEGRLGEALAEYQRVLMLDPANSAAVSGIEGLLQIAATGAQIAVPQAVTAVEAPTAPVVTAPAATVVSPTPTLVAATPTPASPEGQLWAKALSAYEAGDYQAAVDSMLRLQQEAPLFKADEAGEMLYNAYVNLAAEEDQVGNLEAALAHVDKALALRPNAGELRTARTMAAKYLEMLDSEGADWEQTIQLLEELFVQDPSYRDVIDRLQVALLAYGDKLTEDEKWCEAAEQYRAAIAIEITPGSVDKSDELEAKCDALKAPAVVIGLSPTATRVLAGGPTSAANEPAADEEETATPEPTSQPATSGPPTVGRIVFSALDPINGRNHVYAKSLSNSSSPTILMEDGQQPAFRPDGQRFVFRNMRNDMAGLTAFDPVSGLELRFTSFGEDSQPSWNAEGNLLAFSSNREGDRLWRIYTVWADVNSEATVMVYGDSPAWHPGADRIAYRGCDDSGNRCGIWVMNGSGGDRSSLTTEPSDDRPSWSPDGQFVAFMSNGRHGNSEIYRVNVSDRQVVRLTENGGIDGLPAVSPDGRWVAFLSNRGGNWAIWTVPSAGGDAQLLVDIEGGVGNWQEQGIQWMN